LVCKTTNNIAPNEWYELYERDTTTSDDPNKYIHERAIYITSKRLLSCLMFLIIVVEELAAAIVHITIRKKKKNCDQTGGGHGSIRDEN